MRLIRVGLCSVNSTVGAVRDNTDRVLRLAQQAAADDVTVAAFPEQVLGGYPPEDTVQWRRFVQAQLAALARLAAATRELPTVLVVGALAELSDEVYNCAAVLHRGRVLGLVPKEKLPLYNVFYEARTLSRGAPGRRGALDARVLAEVPALRAVADDDGVIPFGDYLFAFDFGVMAVEVCEDSWSPDGPMRRRCFAGAELVVNVSASPYRMGVVETRREMINTRAADNNATVVYTNLVGANDGLVFDGGGLVSQNGRLLCEAPRFREGFAAVTLDLDRTRRLRLENTTWRTDREARSATGQPELLTAPGSTAGERPLRYPTPPHRSYFLPGPERAEPARQRFCEDLLDVMALGIGDYFQKTRAFKQIGVALSGGRDSLLCLILAHRFVLGTLPADASAEVKAAQVAGVLRAFYMPTRYSSDGTRRAAQVAAEELGVPFVILPIEEAFEREVEAARRMLQPGEELTQITVQNIQSRLRAQRMWNWSNATAGLFLQTGNMSEKAVGYTTIGGDLMGCIAPIANLPKTVVNYLLDYLLEQKGWEGIRATLAVPASAELANDQQDERDLMPFPLLDSCFALFAGEKLAPDEIAAALSPLFPEYPQEQVRTWVDKFTRLFSQSIYKWVQSPLSIHVGNLDLERERALQLPVVARTQWLEGER